MSVMLCCTWQSRVTGCRRGQHRQGIGPSRRGRWRLPRHSDHKYKQQWHSHPGQGRGRPARHSGWWCRQPLGALSQKESDASSAGRFGLTDKSSRGNVDDSHEAGHKEKVAESHCEETAPKRKQIGEPPVPVLCNGGTLFARLWSKKLLGPSGALSRARQRSQKKKIKGVP